MDETNSLIIQGKNSFQEPKNPIMRQYNVGDYYRAFQLSDQYDKERISAKFENGLLELLFPEKKRVSPGRSKSLPERLCARTLNCAGTQYAKSCFWALVGRKREECDEKQLLAENSCTRFYLK